MPESQVSSAGAAPAAAPGLFTAHGSITLGPLPLAAGAARWRVMVATTCPPGCTPGRAGGGVQAGTAPAGVISSPPLGRRYGHGRGGQRLPET